LEGKKALVMGVSNQRSIGWAITDALHREGAHIAFSHVADVRMRRNIDKLVADWEDGDESPKIVCDVQSSEEIAALFQQLDAEWGSLDILVHSIAYGRREDLVGEFSAVDWDGYALAHHVSAFSLIETSRHARPLMRKAGGGSIMAMTYNASARVVPGYNVMATAKAALETNVRYLAAEFGGDNIRVNTISAGPLRTLAASAVGGIREAQRVVEARAPLKRNVTLEEVGNTALFLASDLSTCITGQTIYADCGFSIVM
jgi:enoyl-[acyl-carrier protein] reductase I